MIFVANGQNTDIVSKFKHLPIQKLLDTANYHYDKSSFDTALACYTLFINTASKDTDLSQQQKMIEALNKSGIIYCYKDDYFGAYKFFTSALLLAERFNDVRYQARILLNIGNVYARFNKHDIAESYYSKVLQLSEEAACIVLALNNLGVIRLDAEKLDDGFNYLNKSLQISKENDNVFLFNMLNNFSLYYKKKQNYDSAFYYARLALDEARKHNHVEREAEYLSDLAALFFDVGKIDSALLYLDQSNKIAIKNNFLRILAQSHLTRSKIEKSKGHNKAALEYFEKHTELKDLIANAGVMGDIKQLQHSYDALKMNQQIEQLIVEQKIKEHTIFYQKVIQYIILAVLLLVSGILVFVFYQNRKLTTAYKSLFGKNLEIIDLQYNSSKKDSKKYKKSTLPDDVQDELLNKILTLMTDTSIICDTEFSIDKLAELVQSNQKYVSQVINNSLKKNFRSFLNSYRIREAQHLFSEPDATKYTIESVALRVGFKSRHTFREAFKEITGVSPNFYLKAMQSAKN
jgi:AraC-like DNA-binding protein/Tfp pilus assembly protein PilF